MILKAYNRKLIEDRVKTNLTAAVSVGATTLTVAAVNADVGTGALWSDNTYLIVGEIGTPNAEILQMNGTASDGTSLTVDQLGAGGARFAHAIGEPVYRIDYNRVEFNRNTTDSTSGVTVLATELVNVSEEFTFYEDTTNTTGYGFVRFNNQTSGAFSSYSDGVNYEAGEDRSSFDPRTVWMMMRKVRKLLNEIRESSRVTDRDILEALNDKQRDLGHQRLWSFYETERSFASVANQFRYAIPSSVMKAHSVKFDTQPLVYRERSFWDLLHWDSDTSSGDPVFYNIWEREIKVWPRPSAAAQTTAINDAAGISATATSVTVDSTSGFNRGDYYRFIIDSEVIYATASTSTTFTGLRRGMEGTTAATHADDATITERDIVYPCHVEPDDLLDTQDRTEVPEPDVLVYGAAIDLAPMVGKAEAGIIDRWERKYESKMKQLEAKYASKQSSQHGRIKDYGEVISATGFARADPNRYPNTISGS